MSTVVRSLYREALLAMKAQRDAALIAMNDAYDRFLAGHLDNLDETDPLMLGRLEAEYLAAHGEWAACDIAFKVAVHRQSR